MTHCVRTLVCAATLAALSLSCAAADLAVSVLDRNGKPLPDAVVLVDSGVPGARPAPVMEAAVTQEKLRFVPAVTVVGLGAKVAFSNLDSWDHHVIVGLMGTGGVYLDPSQNTQMRLAGKKGDKVASESRTLNQPGVYLLGCHIHSSMKGHVYVADTPWARLTGADGKTTIPTLPEGPARVRVWHPDQIIDGAPVEAKVTATGASLVVQTQIVPQRKRQASGNDAYPY